MNRGAVHTSTEPSGAAQSTSQYLFITHAKNYGSYTKFLNFPHTQRKQSSKNIITIGGEQDRWTPWKNWGSKVLGAFEVKPFLNIHEESLVKHALGSACCASIQWRECISEVPSAGNYSESWVLRKHCNGRQSSGEKHRRQHVHF